MARSRFRVLDQQAWVVTHDTHRGVVTWTAHEINGTRRTEAVMMVPERTLIPRDAIAYGMKVLTRGIEVGEVERWLASRGYTVAS